MHKAEFEVEAITPIFMRGADQDQSQAEIRASSIKGLMRWWFRALAGNYFGDDVAGLKKVEDYVFGSTGGRSRVVVELKIDNLKYSKSPLPMVWRKDRITKKTIERLKSNAIEGKFKVCIESYNNDLLELAFYSLYTLFTLGSIGFRHTRGAGSIKINAINYENFKPNVNVSYDFKDKNDFCRKINGTISKIIKATNKIIRDLANKLNFKPNPVFSDCCRYSALIPNCAGIYVWYKNNGVKDIYYKSDEPSRPESLLDHFENKFKSYSNINYGFENYIFGLPRANKRKYRRISPMHVGVVKTNNETFLKIIIFKTDPYHPKVKVNWSDLDKFLEDIEAEKIWPEVFKK